MYRAIRIILARNAESADRIFFIGGDGIKGIVLSAGQIQCRKRLPFGFFPEMLFFVNPVHQFLWIVFFQG